VRFFESYNVVIECVEINPDATDEQDLVNDLMMLMASFSGKLYGRRSAKRRKEKKELKEKGMKV
jgi:putative resolvase